MQHGFPNRSFSPGEPSLRQRRNSISNIHIEPAVAAYRAFEKGADITRNQHPVGSTSAATSRCTMVLRTFPDVASKRTIMRMISPECAR